MDYKNPSPPYGHLSPKMGEELRTLPNIALLYKKLVK